MNAAITNKSAATNRKAVLYMALLALQFGIQPVLTRRFTPPTVTRSTVILTQECIKMIMAWTMLRISGSTEQALKGWSVSTWVSVAAVPAALYSIQNMAALTAYQNLDALTYNVLNQTKTLSAAFCCYLVMGKRQSSWQVLALLLLLVAALIIEGIISLDWMISMIVTSLNKSNNDEYSASPNISAVHENDNNLNETLMDENSSSGNNSQQWQDARHWTHGVAPILLASFISGLAGALSQKNLQATAGGGRDAYLFSAELCAASIFILTASLLVSPDGEQISQRGFWYGWNWKTFIPIVTNAAGGIVVGLVTKFAGSVQKGFALIFGILLSGIIQAWFMQKNVTKEQIAGGIVAAMSLYLHAANPPRTKNSNAKKSVKQD